MLEFRNCDHIGKSVRGPKIIKSPDTYDDAVRDDGSITINPSGIFSGRQASNSLSGIGPDLTLSLRPREWAAVGEGIQWDVLENFKLLAEYSRHEFRNNLSTPSSQKIDENFFTVRARLGF